MNKFKYLLLAALAACAASAAADEAGLVLIRADVQMVDDVTHPSFGGNNHTRGIWLTNLATRKSYGDGLSGELQIIEVPEGIYCVGAVDISQSNLSSIDYCGEPYFKVSKGHLTNAGTWHFGYSTTDSKWRLWQAAVDLDETFDAAARYTPHVVKLEQDK